MVSVREKIMGLLSDVECSIDVTEKSTVNDCFQCPNPELEGIWEYRGGPWVTVYKVKWSHSHDGFYFYPTTGSTCSIYRTTEQTIINLGHNWKQIESQPYSTMGDIDCDPKPERLTREILTPVDPHDLG